MENERDLLKQANNIAILGECFAWLQWYDECIERLEERSRAKRPNRQSLVARITRLEGAKTRLQRHFIHFGGDYIGTNSSERLVWREIDTAFENRTLTGAVINANYIEQRQFLEDAGCVVLEQMRDVIERHNGVKVNTVFNGEFVAGDKHANKSINMRNFDLSQTSNLHSGTSVMSSNPHWRPSKSFKNVTANGRYRESSILR